MHVAIAKQCYCTMSKILIEKVFNKSILINEKKNCNCKPYNLSHHRSRPKTQHHSILHNPFVASVPLLEPKANWPQANRLFYCC